MSFQNNKIFRKPGGVKMLIKDVKHASHLRIRRLSGGRVYYRATFISFSLSKYGVYWRAAFIRGQSLKEEIRYTRNVLD